MIKSQMPKKLKKRWLKALRSGKYKQGTDVMYNHKTKTFCCLGVLEHIALDGQVEIYTPVPYGSPKYRAVPSPEFNRHFECAFDIDALIARNDGYGTRRHSFKEIANWIARNIEGI